MKPLPHPASVVRLRGDDLLFNYESFAELIEEIGSFGYSFQRIDDTLGNEPGKVLYLRHDVDISAIAAARIGEIEHSLGAKSSFFFLLGADTYNLLDPRNMRIIDRLRSMGHCVGLHIDQRLFDDDERTVYRTLEWFKKCVTDIDLAVSFHRPTVSVLSRDYTAFASAYRPEIFSDEHYLSDSRRSPEFYTKLQTWLRQGRTPVQLLLHPGWWYPRQNVEEYRNDLVKRRIHEIDSYLGANFNKVFGELVSHENSAFGL